MDEKTQASVGGSMTLTEHINAVVADSRARLGNKITIQDWSTHFVLGDDTTIYDDGKIDIVWECQHVNTGKDSTDMPFMTFGGVKSYEVVSTVCDDCSAVYNEISEEWNE